MNTIENKLAKACRNRLLDPAEKLLAHPKINFGENFNKISIKDKEILKLIMENFNNPPIIMVKENTNYIDETKFLIKLFKNFSPKSLWKDYKANPHESLLFDVIFKSTFFNSGINTKLSIYLLEYIENYKQKIKIINYNNEDILSDMILSSTDKKLVKKLIKLSPDPEKIIIHYQHYKTKKNFKLFDFLESREYQNKRFVTFFESEEIQKLKFLTKCNYSI